MSATKFRGDPGPDVNRGRDHGSSVTVVWTPDPDLAEQLRDGDAETFDRLVLDTRLEIEPVRQMRKVSRQWLVSDGSGGWHPAGTRKADAFAALRSDVTDHFTRQEA